MKTVISGIQQVGIGIPNVHEAWKWYRKYFGMDVPIFEEAAEANLMLPYTGGKPHQRHAVLAVNMQGGGGFEIWQYTSRTPQPPEFEPLAGDYGIYAVRIKSRDVKAAYEYFQEEGLDLLTNLSEAPDGSQHFFLKDAYGNVFQVVKGSSFFADSPSKTGGPAGCMIGVSNIEAAQKLYSDILGYNQIVYDETGIFDDMVGLPGGEHRFRRVLLTHKKARQGGFSRMFGPTSIELVQVQDREARKIFKDRYWGDLGFIHLCFDIMGMDALRSECEAKGFPFTVDSASALGKVFDMGEAAGLFSYIEDPDGTLIEFVETHKVPILKKLGWYLNMKKRDPYKPLPDWMLKTLRFNRVKD